MRPETQAPSPPRSLLRAATLLTCALALPTTVRAAPPTGAAPRIAPLGEDEGPAPVGAPESAPAGTEEVEAADEDEDEPLVPPAWTPPPAAEQAAPAEGGSEEGESAEGEAAEGEAAEGEAAEATPPAEAPASAEAPYTGTDAYGMPLTAEEAALLAEDEDGPDPESGLMTQVGLSLALGKATDAEGRNAGSNAGTAVRAFLGAAVLPQLCLGVTGIYAAGSANNDAYTVDTQGLLLTSQWRPFGGERHGVVLGLGVGLGSTTLTQAREEAEGKTPFVGSNTGGLIALSVGWTADALNLGAHHRLSLAPTFTWLRFPAQGGSDVDHELFTLGVDLRWMASTGPRKE